MARVLFIIMFFLNIRTCLNFNMGSENKQTVSTVWITVRETVTSLSEDVHGYLVSLFGKQVVDTLIKAVRNAIQVTSEAAANAVATAGVNANVPVSRVTPEGVIFVIQWALLAVVGYWILSLAVSLVAGVVRSVLWLLKITFAVVMFGLILSDSGASAETTAMRLAVLVFACVLLGVGPALFRKDATTNLEGKVKVLESRVREMEKKKKRE